jgi:hypothetical protein
MDINFLNILIIALAVENTTHLFLRGSIFNPVKNILMKLNFFEEMFSCFLCTSFWVSVFMSLLAIYYKDAHYIFALMIIHGFSRYLNTTYAYILTGTKSTVPFQKSVKYED